MRERGETKIRAAFKRFETDEEYRARLIAGGVPPWKVMGEDDRQLDAIGDRHQIQRRLVEDVA